MKSAFIVSAFAASLAFAGPLERREYAATVSTTAVVAVTASIDLPSQTDGSPGRFYGGWWGRFGQNHAGENGPPGGWWEKPKPNTSTASSTSSPLPSPSSSAAEFYSAAPTSSQAVSTSQEPSLTQAPSSTSPAFSTQSAPSTSSQQTQPQQGDDSWQGDQPYSMTYAKPIVDAHNTHRANHSVPNLKWSRRLEDAAKQISATCIYGHSKAAGDGDYGQNIGAGSAPQNVDSMITNGMYNDEIELYPGPYGGEPDMHNFEAWGHYSQLVWAATQEVGCYTTDCNAQGLANVAPNVGKQFTVCNYFPAGNFAGEYGANVPQPGKMAPIFLNISN